MALVFHRRLAVPLWATAFLAVAVTPPPTAMTLMPPITLFLIAAVGSAVVAGTISRLRASRSLVLALPSRDGIR
jgi:hypothetical protein